MIETLERTQKPDYEWTVDENRPSTNRQTPVKRRKSDSLRALLKTGDIQQQHVNAAERWYRDWVLATVGHFEHRDEASLFLIDEAARCRHDERMSQIEASRAAGYVHDTISWGIMRGRAACRLSVVRDKIRRPGELILRFLVADGVSFCEMGKAILPPAAQAYNSARVIRAQCVLVLDQLEDIYRPENRNLFDVCYLSADRAASSRSLR